MNSLRIICACLFLALPQGYAASTNASAHVVKRPISDVITAMQAFVATTNRPAGFILATNEISGVSCRIEFSDCSPLRVKSIWPVQMWPFLKATGWRPPPQVSYWSGTFVATKESKDRTRLTVTPKVARDKLSELYLEAILEQLPAKQ